MEEVILLSEACNKRLEAIYGESSKKGKIDKGKKTAPKKLQTMEQALEKLTEASKKYPGKLDCIVEVG